MKLPLRFKIGDLEFLIPENYQGAYIRMQEAAERADITAPPSKGDWLAGSINPNDILWLSELHDLGVLPNDFFDYPVVSGSFWYNWSKGEADKETKKVLGYVKPRPESPYRLDNTKYNSLQSFFLTNWASSRTGILED